MADSDFEDYYYSDEYDDDGSEDFQDSDGGGGKASSSYVHSPGYEETRTENEFRILEPEQVLEKQQEGIVDLAEVLDIPMQCAGVLLRHFRWNKERLFDKYYANPTKVQKEAGVQYLAKDSTQTTEVTCEICYDTVSATQAFGMGCNHRFCRDCWEPYLRVAVGDGPTCIYTKCPAQGCNEVVNSDVFCKILKGQKADYNKYLRWVNDSFVDTNRNVQWCPGQECGRAILASGAVTAVRCTCNTCFCFKCGSEAHAPTSCAHLEQWMDKCKNESETANWILANTKKCPRCTTRIEKNQGCNHMTCKQCKFEFCWICSGPWSDHGTSTGGYYKCNRYTGDSKRGRKGKKTDKDLAKAELDRYLHYFQRYANHDQALKIAGKRIRAAERRMQELQESSKQASWIDVQFLREATDELIECRRVLKYTYCHAYYLEDSKEKHLFEDHQSQLESHTEKLTELSEMNLDKIDRAQTINYTRVTAKFRENLLEAAENDLADAPVRKPA